MSKILRVAFRPRFLTVNFARQCHFPQRTPPPSEGPPTKTFESTSKPRPYSGRPPPRYNLPLQTVCPPLLTREECAQIDFCLETLATRHGIHCIRGSRLGCFLHRCLESRENIKLHISANHAHGQKQRWAEGAAGRSYQTAARMVVEWGSLDRGFCELIFQFRNCLFISHFIDKHTCREYRSQLEIKRS